MKRIIAAIIIILMLCLAAGCESRPADGGETAAPEETPYASVPAATEVPTAEPTPEPSPEPTPTGDPEAHEALRLAELHGLSAEDIRGEYALFLRFAQTVDANPGLDEYTELVYRLFPLIADHTAFMDADHFFDRLAGLSFEEGELDYGNVGLYSAIPNTITIGTDLGLTEEYELPSVIYHELVHFVDFSISPAGNAMYLLNGERLSAEELLALPIMEQLGAVIVYPADFLTEGGAELCTAKYFAGAVRWYFDSCRFLTGLEYIFGEEKLSELFFSADSEVLMAELFLEAGYSKEDYYDAVITLNFLTDPLNNPVPARRLRAEDILIDLYEYRLGGGWQTDEYFLYILKMLNGVAWSGYETSAHADFLSGIQFDTWEEYNAFLDKVYRDLPMRPELLIRPAEPVIIGGRETIAAFASWTDPDTEAEIHGTISVEYDFESGTPLGCRFIDMDAEFIRYFR